MQTIIRHLQNGRLQSQDKSQVVVDIFVNDNLYRQIKKQQITTGKDEILCIHWDDSSHSSVSTFSLTENQEVEGDSTFERSVCTRLVDDPSELWTLLLESYNVLSIKLARVRVRPLTFIFLNVKEDAFSSKKELLIKLFRDLVSNSCSPMPKINLNHNLSKITMDPCRAIVHGTYRGHGKSMESRQAVTVESSGIDYDGLNRRLDEDRQSMEQQFKLLREQTQQIWESLSLAVGGKKSSKAMNDPPTQTLETDTTCDFQKSQDKTSQSQIHHLSPDEATQRPFENSTNTEASGVVNDVTNEGSNNFPKEQEMMRKRVSEGVPASVNTEKIDSTSANESKTNKRVSTQQRDQDKLKLKKGSSDKKGDSTSRWPVQQVKTEKVSKEQKESSATRVDSSHVSSSGSRGAAGSLFPKARSTGGSKMIKTISDVQAENSDDDDQLGALSRLLPSLTDGSSPSGGSQHLSSLAETKEDEWKHKKEIDERKRELGSLLGKVKLDQLLERRFRSLLRTGSSVRIEHGDFLDVIRRYSSEDDKHSKTMTRSYVASLPNEAARQLPITSKGLDTVICVDTSASIGETNLQQVKTILNKFLDGIETVAEEQDVEENIGLVTFGGEAKVVHHLTNDYESLRACIDGLQTGGSSPLLEAIAAGFACIANGGICKMNQIMVRPRFVLITDGIVTQDGENEESLKDNDKAREEMKTVFSTHHLDALLARRSFWIPAGDADRGFLKSLAQLCDGEFVEAADVDSISRYQHSMQITGSALELVQTEKLSTENFETVLSNAIDSLAPHIPQEQKSEVTQHVKEALLDLDDDSPSTEAFGNIVQLPGMPPLGSRVVRGPDWKWDNQDENGPGTVFNHRVDQTWLWVKWDCGHVNQYRYGADLGFDLLVSETRPPQSSSLSLQIGVQVERGPHWSDNHGDQDGGPGNHGVVIRKKDGEVMVRWDANGNIYKYSFGTGDIYEVAARDQQFPQTLGSTASSPIKEQNRHAPVAPGGRPYTWQRLGERGQWEDYDKDEDDTLKTQYNRRPDGLCDLTRNHQQYIVSFKDKTERSVASGKTTKIRKRYPDMDRWN